MKKTLIAALIAGIPAVAAADVTVYGIIKGGVESVDSNGARATTIDDLGSRIGFKGSEDLGNGLKAIWQVEQGFNIDDGSEYKSGMGSFANRQSFIGLASEFGTLRLGNISNYADSDLGSVDAWEYGSDALGLGIFTRDQARVKNAVRYDSPEFYGVKASFLYGTKEDKKGLTTKVIDDKTGLPTGKENWEDTDRETYNLGLSYDYANFFAKYSYEQESAMTYKDADKKAVQDPKSRKQWLEVGYDANNLFVAVAYKQSKGDYTILPYHGADEIDFDNGDNGDSLKTKEIALTVAYTLGNFTPKFSYAQGSDIKFGGNDLVINTKNAAGDMVKMDKTGYKQFVIGTDYALSKRTILGAQYGQLKLDDGAAALYGLKAGEDTVKAFGVNMIHKF